MPENNIEIEGDESFTVNQIVNMGNCVNWKPNNLSKNYYNNGSMKSRSWEELIFKGYAVSERKQLGSIVYHLTDKGLNAVRIFTNSGGSNES